MPLSKKGEKILAAMIRQYGEEKGKRTFHASRNKGTIKGVEKAAEGKVLSGPSLVRVGKHDDEYALLMPGSVVAPMPKGEKPTMAGGLRAVLEQLFESLPAGKVQGMQGGGVAASPARQQEWQQTSLRSWLEQQRGTLGRPSSQTDWIGNQLGRLGATSQTGQGGRAAELEHRQRARAQPTPTAPVARAPVPAWATGGGRTGYVEPGAGRRMEMQTANWGKQTAAARAAQESAQSYGMSRILANPSLGRSLGAATRGRAGAGAVARSVLADGGVGGGAGGGTPTPTSTPTPPYDPNAWWRNLGWRGGGVVTGMQTGGVATPTLPEEIMQLPFLRDLFAGGGGSILQGMVGTAQPFGPGVRMPNWQAMNYYDYLKQPEWRQEMTQGIASAFGMPPEQAVEQSRRATGKTLGAPMQRGFVPTMR